MVAVGVKAFDEELAINRFIIAVVVVLVVVVVNGVDIGGVAVAFEGSESSESRAREEMLRCASSWVSTVDRSAGARSP